MRQRIGLVLKQVSDGIIDERIEKKHVIVPEIDGRDVFREVDMASSADRDCEARHAFRTVKVRGEKIRVRLVPVNVLAVFDEDRLARNAGEPVRVARNVLFRQLDAALELMNMKLKLPHALAPNRVLYQRREDELVRVSVDC